jgi:hypothetical protein
MLNKDKNLNEVKVSLGVTVLNPADSPEMAIVVKALEVCLTASVTSREIAQYKTALAGLAGLADFSKMTVTIDVKRVVLGNANGQQVVRWYVDKVYSAPFSSVLKKMEIACAIESVLTGFDAIERDFSIIERSTIGAKTATVKTSKTFDVTAIAGLAGLVESASKK